MANTAASADLSAWPADVRDTCGNVFGQALRACQPAIPANACVLEIGCAEFDWLAHATAAWPDMAFTGIDWRPSLAKRHEVRLQGDVMQADFAPESVEWIVAVSSIEHIGLGHYQHDPTAEDGDSITMQHAYRWLVPGGWMYFDVPYNPAPHSYEVVRTAHRVYDEDALRARLLPRWTLRWSGLYGMHGEDVTEPHALKGGESFYYRACWAQKA